MRDAIAVLIPTTSPRTFTSGPPELPGLIGASTWMKFSYPWRFRMPTPVRFNAETIPWVIEPTYPNGLPNAMIQSPFCKSSLLPHFAGISRSASIFTTPARPW